MAEVVFRLPDLGEGLLEAHIAEWYCREGDIVQLNQRLLEVETEKSAVEIPSPHAGKVLRLHRAQGETVKVGDDLITFQFGKDDSVGSGIVGKVPASSSKARRVHLRRHPVTPSNQDAWTLITPSVGRACRGGLDPGQR